MFKESYRIINIIHQCFKYRAFELLNTTDNLKIRVIKIIQQIYPFKVPASSDKPIKNLMQNLGTIYIKLGQMLATRDLFSEENINKQLKELQDQVYMFKPEQGRKIIEEELGCKLDTIFTEFNAHPIAAASIAQIYSAKLKNNQEKVIIKVARPDVKKNIATDIAIIQKIIKILEFFKPKIKALNLQEIVKNYHISLINELNLKIEAANTKKLKANAKASKILYIPKIYDKFTTNNIMVVEYIEGIAIDDIEALTANEYNLKKLAENGVEIFFTQVFVDNFFHADMHAGNIFVALDNKTNPRYIGIDCAVVGSLSEQDKNLIAKCFLAFFHRNYEEIVAVLIKYGWTKNINQAEFQIEVERICEPLFMKSFQEISFGKFLLDLFNIAERYQITMQPQLFLLQKTIFYIEGLGKKIYPQLDLWQTAQPFLEKWLKEQTSLKTIINKTKDQIPKVIEGLPQIPDLINQHFATKQELYNHQKQILAIQKESLKIQKMIACALLLIIATIATKEYYEQIIILIKFGLLVFFGKKIIEFTWNKITNK